MSSYVDLAPLYGNDQETQNKLRIRDGRGLLHPDVFAEDRLLLLPPGVCTIQGSVTAITTYVTSLIYSAIRI